MWEKGPEDSEKNNPPTQNSLNMELEALQTALRRKSNIDDDLLIVCYEGNDLEIMHLVSKGADVNSSDEFSKR